jgi:simple sugar transport system permease protein
MGGDSAQIALAIPKVVTGVFKGILLFLLLAGETLTKYQINVKPRQRSVPND